MALKHLPQSERLLSGLLSVLLNAVDTTATVSNPPDATRLPTYIEFEPGGGNAELVRVVGVAGSIITIERGVNNGGIGLPHAQNSAYKEKFTSSHWQAVVDAIENGFMVEDSTYSFARTDTDTFTITGADLTGFYTAGRIVRLNGSTIVTVVSSSYGANVTTVNTVETTVPTPITSVEVAIQPINAADSFVTLNGTQTLTNKTLTSPKVGTAIKDTNGNEIIETPATSSAVNHIKVTNSATGNAPKIEAVGDDANVDVEIKGKGTGMPKINTLYGDITADSDGATVTFDMSVTNKHTVTLGGNRTLAVSNVKVGQVFIITLKQDGTGSRTVTWFSGISWAGGSAPTLTTTLNKADTFGFITTGSGAYQGYIIGQNI